jgi:hypothetical protein
MSNEMMNARLLNISAAQRHLDKILDTIKNNPLITDELDYAFRAELTQLYLSIHKHETNLKFLIMEFTSIDLDGDK